MCTRLIASEWGFWCCLIFAHMGDSI
jgi:hypothetical protein